MQLECLEHQMTMLSSDLAAFPGDAELQAQQGLGTVSRALMTVN